RHGVGGAEALRRLARVLPLPLGVDAPGRRRRGRAGPDARARRRKRLCRRRLARDRRGRRHAADRRSARCRRLAPRGVRVPRAAPSLVATVAIVALLCAYGAARVRQIAARTAAGTPIIAGIVQADLSHYDRMRAEIGAYETVRRVLDTHFAMSRALLASAKLD